MLSGILKGWLKVSTGDNGSVCDYFAKGLKFDHLSTRTDPIKKEFKKRLHLLESDSQIAAYPLVASGTAPPPPGALSQGTKKIEEDYSDNKIPSEYTVSLENTVGQGMIL